MKNLYLILLLFITNQLKVTSTQRSSLERHVRLFRRIRIALYKYHERELKDANYRRDIIKSGRLQMVINDSIPFPCGTWIGKRSSKRPTSVHRLKPGDIDVIAAIGDSMSTGVGLTSTNLMNSFSENRELVFTIGGKGTWRNVTTLPNILKEFNKNLVGYAVGPSLSTDRKSQFDVAENGAIVANMPYMAKVLVNRIRRDPRVDFENDWKMVSMLIGANDFCSDICYLKRLEDAVELHRRNILETLRIFKDNLPRTYVNVIPAPDVTVLAKFNNLPPNCVINHLISCPCAVGKQFEKSRRRIREMIVRLIDLQIEISNYDEFDREDFAVVAQPMLVNVQLPILTNGSTDRSFFSTDCFHFSQKAHSNGAWALWNNLFEPIGSKTMSYRPRELKCPSERFPYICTKRNCYS